MHQTFTGQLRMVLHVHDVRTKHGQCSADHHTDLITCADCTVTAEAPYILNHDTIKHLPRFYAVNSAYSQFFHNALGRTCKCHRTRPAASPLRWAQPHPSCQSRKKGARESAHWQGPPTRCRGGGLRGRNHAGGSAATSTAQMSTARGRSLPFRTHPKEWRLTR